MVYSIHARLSDSLFIHYSGLLWLVCDHCFLIIKLSKHLFFLSSALWPVKRVYFDLSDT